MNALTSYVLVVDNHFGQKTLDAVKSFQKAKGLAGSGMIGDKTLEYLGLKVVPSTVVVPVGTSNQDKVLVIANKEIGVKEITGASHNKRILEYHSTTGKFSDDETSWCGSFVSWCLKEAGLLTLGSEGAGARNWLKYGTATTKPKPGDIVVYWRESKSGWKGHVHFYQSEDANYIYGIGGNQGNAVTLARYPKSQVLGYRTY